MAAPRRPQSAAPLAVALSYAPEDAAARLAPRVVANGQGTFAEAIITRARAHGIPVHESRELVAALMQFDLDQRIPAGLYVAVAEVLVWARHLETQAQPLPAAPRSGAPGAR